MQAIIMAAGRGSRMEGLTEERPKCFLEIKGIKLIEYNIALLHANGVTDIVIVTGHQHQMLESYLNNRKGICFVYNPFYEFMNVLGSFYMGQSAVRNEEDLIYMHADTLCAPEVFERMLQREGDMVLPVDFGECDEEAMKVKTEKGKLVEISKQIPCSEAEGEFIGMAKISRSIIPVLKDAVIRLMEAKAFNSYFEGVITEFIKEKKYDLNTIGTNGHFWGEIDFLEDYKKVEKMLPQELVDLAVGDRKDVWFEK